MEGVVKIIYTRIYTHIRIKINYSLEELNVAIGKWLKEHNTASFKERNYSSSLMEIIEDRHVKRSTIITSQLPIKGWYEVIGEQTIADAILDRVVYNARRIELKGE